MKSFKFFVLTLVMGVSLIALASPVFAYQCKQGNDSSDECWTEVKVGAGYTTLVSRGHVLIASMTGALVADNDGYLVRLSGASTDNAVLGVAQKNIASGESALILVRGRGYVKLQGGSAAGATVASADRLGPIASGTTCEATIAGGPSIGTALQNGSDADSNGNIIAYIKV